MLNSLVFRWKRNFEVTLGSFSVLVAQIYVLESYLDISVSVLKLVMNENVKIMIISALKSKFYQYSRLVQVAVLRKTRVNDNMLIRPQRSPRVSEDW